MRALAEPWWEIEGSSTSSGRALKAAGPTATSAVNCRARDSTSSLTLGPGTTPPREGGVTATRPSTSVMSVRLSRWVVAGNHSRRTTTPRSAKASATASGVVPGAMSTPSVRFQRCEASWAMGTSCGSDAAHCVSNGAVMGKCKPGAFPAGVAGSVGSVGSAGSAASVGSRPALNGGGQLPAPAARRRRRSTS